MKRPRRPRLSLEDQVALRLPGNGEKSLEGTIEQIRRQLPSIEVLPSEMEIDLRRTFRHIYTDAHNETRDAFADPFENLLYACEQHLKVHGCEDPHLKEVVPQLRKFLEDSVVPHWGANAK